ncbi:hypothetical protein [Pseudomonas sp. LRF_L74]|uniref:hypothetical protein n=1 Tax=Pseudomonas sp. LRF_L74 TaxID=3369422 RepID=UPI003F62A607
MVRMVWIKPGNGMKLLTSFSRLLGAQVCKVKGCRYHFPNGCFDSWKTYGCIRCHEWSRSFDDTPERGPDDFDPWDEYQSLHDVEEGERLYQIDSRWFSCLPFPRWI